MIHVRLRWRFESLVAMWTSPKLKSMRRRSLWRLPKSAGPRDSLTLTFGIMWIMWYLNWGSNVWSLGDWDILGQILDFLVIRWKVGHHHTKGWWPASGSTELRINRVFSKTWQRMERTPMPCQPARCLHPAGSLGDYRWVRSWVEQDPNRICSQEKLLSFFLSCLMPSMIVFGAGNRHCLEDSPSARQPWTCPWIHCGQNHSADWDNTGSTRCGDVSIWFKVHRHMMTHEISLLGWKCPLS